jgi:isopenicillin-N epimerase
VVFVDNATTGCNAVLGSLDLKPGDEIVILDHVYGAVRNTLRHVAAATGARVIEVQTPFPVFDADELLGRLGAAIGPRARLAVIDHITSPSALVIPARAVIAACHKAGVPVLIDGAHAPGMIDLDLTALDAAWYVGNCHKWLMAPKGAAFLWARADRQAGLHPTVISHGYGQGFVAEFDWTGTRDPSAALAVTEALAFHARLGGRDLRARNAALAAEAAAMLAAEFGTKAAHCADCAMALVRLPVPAPVTAADAAALRARLLRAGTDAPVNAINNAAWLRLSAQAYNELADYERLAGLVRGAL